MSLTDLIGITGTSFVLIAFVLLQRNVWQDTYWGFDLLNLIGSLLLAVSAFLLGSLPFLILNLVWSAISFWDLLQTLTNKNQRIKPKVKN